MIVGDLLIIRQPCAAFERRFLQGLIGLFWRELWVLFDVDVYVGQLSERYLHPSHLDLGMAHFSERSSEYFIGLNDAGNVVHLIVTASWSALAQPASEEGRRIARP